MNADERRLTERVLGAVFEVGNTLGCGFLEKVYERALIRELVGRGLKVRAQVRYTVRYKGHNFGDYIADLVVEDTVLIELKCVDALAPEHTAQCLNYLRASGLELCFLVNYQRPKVEWKRLALSHLR